MKEMKDVIGKVGIVACAVALLNIGYWMHPVLSNDVTVSLSKYNKDMQYAQSQTARALNLTKRAIAAADEFSNEYKKLSEKCQEQK